MARDPRGRPRGRAAAGRRRASSGRTSRSGPPAGSRGGGGLGGEQIEGRRATLEVLIAGRRRVREVWIAAGLEPTPVLSRIRDEADRRGVPVNIVTSDELAERARTEAPQGVVVRADPLPGADADALLAADAAFLVALDGVTDPGNLGAVLRSAEASGATGAFLPKRRAVHVTPTVAKAAAGAIEHLPIALVAGIPAALERAGRAGVWSVGLDADGEVELFDLAVRDQPLVLVFGSEGRGLARLTRERCDIVARIPVHGRVASLNVAAAAAVACYEVARGRACGD